MPSHELSTHPKAVASRKWRRENPVMNKKNVATTNRNQAKKAKDQYGISDPHRLQFGTGRQGDLEFRVFKSGHKARSAKKSWFPRLPGETWYAQARRLSKDIPPVCPIFGTEWDLSGGRQSHTSLSFEHHPDGSLGWVSWRANNLMSNATSAELVACADYRRKYEDGEV